MSIDKMRIRWWWQQNSREVIFVAIIYAVTFAICYFVLHLVNWWVSALIALAATPGEKRSYHWHTLCCFQIKKILNQQKKETK
jgi:hypothetical protein